MHKHATDGVSGANPRFPGNAGNGKATKAGIAELNHAYLEARNRQIVSKAAVAEMALQERSGTLIPRRLVALECAFLLSAFRQSLLAAPVDIAREMVVAGAIEEGAAHALAGALDGRFRGLLHELVNLPGRLMDSNWQGQIDGDLRAQVTGEKAGFVERPSVAKAQVAKAGALRERKLQAQRERRASHPA